MKRTSCCVVYIYPLKHRHSIFGMILKGVALLEDHSLSLNINIDAYEIFILDDLNVCTGEKKRLLFI